MEKPGAKRTVFNQRLCQNKACYGWLAQVKASYMPISVDFHQYADTASGCSRGFQVDMTCS